MTLKKIFKKKKSNKKKKYIILFFLISSSLYFYFYLFNDTKKYIVVLAEENNFYVVPKDKGGEKVKNLDKKSLNLKLEQEFDNNLNQLENIYFSIQFYTHNELKKVRKYLEKLNNGDESIYNPKEFFIMALNSEIGTDFFLLYKGFETKELAKNYCVNFLSKLDKCLIVDTTKF